MYCKLHRTWLELVAALDERMAGAPRLVVLLQDEHRLVGPRQQRRRRQARDPAPNHDHIQLLRYPLRHEAYETSHRCLQLHLYVSTT